MVGETGRQKERKRNDIFVVVDVVVAEHGQNNFQFGSMLLIRFKFVSHSLFTNVFTHLPPLLLVFSAFILFSSLSKYIYNGLIKLIKVMPIIKAPLGDKVNNGVYRAKRHQTENQN